MSPFALPSSIARLQARTTAPDCFQDVLAASAVPTPECNADSSLLSGIAGSALSSIKLSACCAIATSLAGVGAGTATLIAVGTFVLGTAVCMAAAHSAKRGQPLPVALAQHGACNDWHTLIGGLAGSTPTTIALTAFASALATEAGDGPPRLGTNGLACLAAMVAAPAMLLVGKSMRAITGEAGGTAASLAPFAVPLVTVGIALGLPAAMLHQQGSSDAALRFVVGFAANMASATVREALTQSTLPAWPGIERAGTGMDYGLREARGHERLASTIVPTLVSSLLFAGSSALTLHYLEAATDLGMAPAGQALLSQSASDIGRRSALRSLVLQSTNEMLEGLWRGLALAGYAGARGIGLRCTNINAGLTDVPAAVRASRGDPATWNRTAVFASARMLDGALPNLLAQLASTPGTTPYWNGFRIGAVLAQGATMARTPVIAAYVLPRMSVDPSLAPAGTGGSHTEPTEPTDPTDPTDSSAASPSASEAAADGSTQTSIVVDSVDATEDTSSSLPTPCADPNLAWA